MKKPLLLLFLAVSALGEVYAQTTAITTFILVRHAEKGNDGTDDPDLKPEGHERAGKFAALLKNTEVSAVYSTRYKRTKNTVAPLAKEKGLEVQVYESVNPEVIEAMIGRHAGGIVVIGGHSNTIPQIANLLTGKDSYKIFPDTDYGNILVIPVLARGKAAQLTWLSY
jgi:2,3-bisphosphoglycerate-dependent phosphoglycerate mutase